MKKSAEELKVICKMYGRPYSNKRKDEVVNQIHKGPADEGVTETERMLKRTHMSPLPDKDRSAHKLGSLNEDNVRGAVKTLINEQYEGLEYKDSWETGFFLSKSYRWLGASLDGMIVMERDIKFTRRVDGGSLFSQE